jgi:spore germination protein GerM
MRSPKLLALGVLTALALSGCGIVIQSAAQPIAVPSHQFRVGPSGPSLRSGRPVDVYFLSNSRLVASARALYVPDGVSLETQLQDTVNYLVSGPTTAEFHAGVTTALSEFPSAQVTVTAVNHGVVSLDLDKSFATLDATQLFEADAQIVYTLTQFPEVSSVILIFGGVREAWLPGGSVIYESVNRSDYKSIGPIAK